MELTIDKDKFMDGISLAAKATGAKNKGVMPDIMNGLLVTAQAGAGVRVTGSSMEMTVETADIEADIRQAGAIVIDARILSETIRRMPAGPIVIKTNINHQASIEAGKTKATVVGQSAKLFPSPLDVERKACVAIPSKDLKRMINNTIFAVSVDDSRVAMTGIYLRLSGNQAESVASDGFRVARSRCREVESTEDISMILPAATMQAVTRMIGNNDEPITIYLSERHTLFVLPSCTVTSRLLEGQFMDYNQFFEQDKGTIITVDRIQFMDAIDRTTAIAVHETGAGKNRYTRLCVEDGTLQIQAKTELGTIDDALDIMQDGKNLEISFSGRYLTEAVKTLEGAEIELHCTTSVAPCVIRCREDENTEHLILPVRIKG